ncbi:glycosyltransferase family 2 protein [Gammaproteobacteria bacterium AH-315-M22]|nr:glycosyltransferase family 2 protein [Gammaproteobacteria bacterium AH-315-M22]
MKYCLVIPHYNHLEALRKFLPVLSVLPYPSIVIDDGSEPSVVEQLTSVIATYDGISLVKHNRNRGKGAAVISGCYQARTLGYSHIIQIDADGQHDSKDIEKFIAYSQQHPQTIISGKPVFDDSAPKARVYGRKVTDFWVALETLSLQIKDSLCGFRLYPLAQMEMLIDRYHIGPRMDFDTDILVKAVWADISLHFVPTKVVYPVNGVSHFRYLSDNWRLIRLHTRLMLGMFLRTPQLLYRRISRIFR